MYHVAENFEGEKLMDFVGQNKAVKMIVYIGMVRRDMYQLSKILPMIITFQTEIVIFTPRKFSAACTLDHLYVPSSLQLMPVYLPLHWQV